MVLRAEAGFKEKIDGWLVGAVLGLVIMGSIAVLSAASPLPYFPQILQRHFLALAVGVLAFLFGFGFNYQIFQDQSKTLYAVTLAVMALVFVFGATIRGHRAWIRMPFFTFQPSEFARVCTVLVLANYLDRSSNRIGSIPAVLGAILIVMPVIGAIVLEPDFSSAVAFFPVWIAMLFCAGANLSHLAAIVGYGMTIGLSLLAWTLLSLHPEMISGSRVAWFLLEVGWSKAVLALTVAGLFLAAYLFFRLAATLRIQIPRGYFMAAAAVLAVGLCTAAPINRHIKDYQRNRFLAFLAPEADPQEAAYNVNQALVAIGSGGMLGKGIFSGTQSQLGFLPERHTDFIYAVVGEELGFVGAVSVLGLYLVLLWRVIAAARLSRDRYGLLVCAGIASMFGFYLMVNVGMCLGVVPVAGIPLPLISYGGSSLVVSLWALGIVLNIYSKRYAFI